MPTSKVKNLCNTQSTREKILRIEAQAQLVLLARNQITSCHILVVMFHINQTCFLSTNTTEDFCFVTEKHYITVTGTTYASNQKSLGT